MSETNKMQCKRCGANENRIHGFCSMECETAWYYEDDIRDLTARIAELEAFIGQLIKAGDAMSNAQSMWVAEEDKWDALVKDWKEREEWN